MKKSDIFALDGKTAVITGGGGVLCSTIAEGLGAFGASIAVCDLDTVKAGATVKMLSKLDINAKAYKVDVLRKCSVERAAKAIRKHFGAIDVLINGAGGNRKEATTSDELSFFDLPTDASQRVLMLNLFGGAMIPSQVFGREMVKNKNGGSIINISSMNAFRPLTRIPAYSAAKASVSNFTMWLAVHLAKEYNSGLRVNAIAPGFFLTEQNRYLLKKGSRLTDRGKTIIKHTPMGEFGAPEDLIGVCVWLASSASRFVTGTVVPIDGGFSAFSGV